MTTRFGNETYIIKPVSETEHIVKTLRKSIKKYFGKRGSSGYKTFAKGKEVLVSAYGFYDTEEEKEEWMETFRKFRKEYSELTGLPDKGGMMIHPYSKGKIEGILGFDIYYSETMDNTVMKEIQRRIDQHKKLREELRPKYEAMEKEGKGIIKLD
jgi:hypothetical protein